MRSNNDKLINICTPSKGEKFLEYEEPENPLCGTCKVYPICMGGCKRYRSFYSQEKDYCPYQDFLYNSFYKLQEIACIVN